MVRDMDEILPTLNQHHILVAHNEFLFYANDRPIVRLQLVNSITRKKSIIINEFL